MDLVQILGFREIRSNIELYSRMIGENIAYEVDQLL